MNSDIERVCHNFLLNCKSYIDDVGLLFVRNVILQFLHDADHFRIMSRSSMSGVLP